MIGVTHGIRRNVGDALIHSRALAILRSVGAGSHEFQSVDREASLPPNRANEFNAVVCAGGPGLRSDSAESVFTILNSIDPTTPAFMLAQGYGGFPSKPDSSYFSDSSVHMLKNRVATPISVRDKLTLDLCQSAGVEAVHTGCVAWYHLPSLGKPLAPSGEPTRIVFTPPAGPRWAIQAVSALRTVRQIWPAAEILCSFHRGILPGQGTSAKQSASYLGFAAAAKLLGARNYDASGPDLSGMECYLDYDLHVGYRVHAHLDFLSRRFPSLLISEDGRGEGQNLSLGDQYCLNVNSGTLADDLSKALASEFESGWAGSADAMSRIDSYWPVMRQFVSDMLEGC